MRIIEAQPAYNRSAKAYIKRRDALIRKKLSAIDNQYLSASDRVIYFIRNVNENVWRPANSQELIDAINGEIDLLGQQIRGQMLNNTGEMVTFSLDNTDKGIRVLGVDVPGIPTQTTDITSLETAIIDTLIKGQTAATKMGIDFEVRTGIASGKSTFEVAKEIKKRFGIDMNKTNRQARTEMLRVDSMTDYQRTTQVAKITPNLRKNWLWSHKPDGRPSHQAAENRYMNNPIPIGEPFKVGGADLMYPHDPAGPAKETINCGCKMGKVII